MRRAVLAAVVVVAVLMASATAVADPPGPVGSGDPVINLAGGFPTSANSFEEAEGILKAPGGHAVVFNESGALPNAGNIWKLTNLNQRTVRGQVLVAGDFARMARPDNIRFTDAGDLFIMEDHGSSDFAQPGTGGTNQVWVLPRGVTGAENLRLFAELPNRFEPDGPVVLERQPASSTCPCRQTRPSTAG